MANHFEIDVECLNWNPFHFKIHQCILFELFESDFSNEQTNKQINKKKFQTFHFISFLILKKYNKLIIIISHGISWKYDKIIFVAFHFSFKKKSKEIIQLSIMLEYLVNLNWI